MSENGSKSKKILLVDDDEFFLEIQRNFLEREYFQILEAKSGEEALETMRSEELDIVLMDLYMPGMDGLETMVRARAEGMIDLPIVIVSREDSTAKIQECKDAGANEFLTKPLQIEELIKTVNLLTKEAHREKPRFSTSIKIRYRSLDDLMTGQTKNISSAGIFIRTRKPIEIGSPIEIHLIPAEGDSAETIRVTGEIVRSLKRNDENSGMGVKFVNLDAESVKLIEELIEAERYKHKVDIMVIDDDRVIREILTDGLTEAGYTVGVAKDGIEALKKLDHLRPTLMLVDIMMPGMSGIEFSKTIRKNAHTQDIPFVFISSKVDKETIMQTRKIGATFFIAKPFDMDNVVEKVGKILPDKTEGAEK